MTEYALLMSPRADAAFFAKAIDVAEEEVRGATGKVPGRLLQGDMTFLTLDADPSDLPALARLASVLGVFLRDGDLMRPMDVTGAFSLHPDFVWGEKYRGKTNETLTQLLLNIALQTAEPRDPAERVVFDPMCGRGTSLLWAMRYGFRAIGVDQDDTVLRDLQRSLKKWTKLHRQKHKLSHGWVQRANKKGVGKYLDFAAADTSLRVIIGETADAFDLLQRKPVDLLISDLPYGVEHKAGRDTRNPLHVISAAAPAWTKCLAPGGAMAIAFNSYLPKRAALIEAFDGLGLEIIERPLAHRMSEAILRDILVLKKPV